MHVKKNVSLFKKDPQFYFALCLSVYLSSLYVCLNINLYQCMTILFIAEQYRSKNDINSCRDELIFIVIHGEIFIMFIQFCYYHKIYQES